MEFNPNIYNQKNNQQYILANELIGIITEENDGKLQRRKFDIVLDIGCGTGNITLILNNKLNINELYAIDIDNEMIKFAKQNYEKSNIQYITQDISVEWQQLTPELKALEGSVSLIFTNLVLHWVVNKENAANNMSRFISDNGKLYANFLWNSDPFDHLVGEEKILHEKQICFPTKDEQMNIWYNLFKKVGFNIIHNEFLEKTAILRESEYIRGLLILDTNCRKQYIKEEDPLIRNDLVNKMTNRLMEKNRKFIDEETGENLIEYKYGIFRFILEKN